MSNINHLNPTPNPFWEFVAEMQDRPRIANSGPFGRPYFFRQGEPAAAQGTAADNAAAASSNTQQEKQAEEKVDDPPEVDPTTVQPQGRERQNIPFRGRRRHESGDSGDENQRRRRCHGRRGWGAHPAGGPFGQPGFPFAGLGGAPFWGRGQHPHAPPPPPHQPPFEHFGPAANPHAHGHDRARAHAHAQAAADARVHPHGRGGFHHRGGPFHGHPGRHGRHGFRGASPPGPPNFDIGQFLSDLGNRIGMDLGGAAQSLGLDRFMPTSASGPDVDFEPRVDIFDRPAEYVVHVSLPGAKKSDLGVDWDGEHSALRVGGVVHRPEVDETMLSQLVVDGRKRETGVFEKLIRLGTRREPANVDVGSIRARMTDGVLIVTVPKTEKQDGKREVPIAKSQTPSPVRDVEQHMFSDVHNNSYYNAEHANTDFLTGDNTDGEIQMIDRDAVEKTDVKGKQAEHGYEAAQRHARESTVGTVKAEDEIDVEAEAEPEQLPAYHPVAGEQQQQQPQQPQHDRDHDHEHDAEDWEHFGSDEEGEYVKINVD